MRSDPSKPFTVIPAIDQAIDWEATYAAFVADGRDPEGAMLEYRLHYDQSLLRFVPGQLPTKFFVRPLSRKERREVRNQATDEDRYDLAFRLTVQRVENGRFMDGTRGTWVRPDDDAARGKPVPEADMERFPESTVMEVGQAVWARSFLDPFSDHVLALPPTSLRELTSRYSPRFHVEPTADSSKSQTDSGEAKAQPPEAPEP